MFSRIEKNEQLRDEEKTNIPILLVFESKSGAISVYLFFPQPLF
jgi:hypothetical protein